MVVPPQRGQPAWLGESEEDIALRDSQREALAAARHGHGIPEAAAVGNHPSRDRPQRVIIPSSRSGNPADEPTGFYIPGQGYYQDEAELNAAGAFWRDEDPEGLTPSGRESNAIFNGATQMGLFDPEEYEKASRLKLGKERFDVMGTPEEADLSGALMAPHAHSPSDRTAAIVTGQEDPKLTQGRVMLEDALRQSRIPITDLQPRTFQGKERKETRFQAAAEERDVGGSYLPVYTSSDPDVVRVDPEKGRGHETIVHELGHRAHYSQLEATPFDPRLSNSAKNPDPLREAIADAYVDRYGGPGSAQVIQMARGEESGQGLFSSYSSPYYGYSTNFAGHRGTDWSLEERALYAAVRGHVSETGEIPEYYHAGAFAFEGEGSHRASVDATLHHLLSNSKHAARALRQNSYTDEEGNEHKLKHVGAAAFQRHEDRVLLHSGQHVQESLFDEPLDWERDKSGENYTGKSTPLPLVPSGEAVGFGDWMETFDKLSETHPDVIIPDSPLQKNQFGKKPRKWGDIQESLGAKGSGRSYAKTKGIT